MCSCDFSLQTRAAYLVAAAGIELARRHDVRQGAEAMEQHGEELDHQDEREEEHEHQTDGLHLQVLLVDENLSTDGEWSALVSRLRLYVSVCPSVYSQHYDREVAILSANLRILYLHGMLMITINKALRLYEARGQLQLVTKSLKNAFLPDLTRPSSVTSRGTN